MYHGGGPESTVQQWPEKIPAGLRRLSPARRGWRCLHRRGVVRDPPGVLRFRQGHRPLLGGEMIPTGLFPVGLIRVPLASLSPFYGERAGDRGLLCHSLNRIGVGGLAHADLSSLTQFLD